MENETPRQVYERAQPNCTYEHFLERWLKDEQIENRSNRKAKEALQQKLYALTGKYPYVMVRANSDEYYVELVDKPKEFAE